MKKSKLKYFKKIYSTNPISDKNSAFDTVTESRGDSKRVQHKNDAWIWVSSKQEGSKAIQEFWGPFLPKICKNFGSKGGGDLTKFESFGVL